MPPAAHKLCPACKAPFRGDVGLKLHYQKSEVKRPACYALLHQGNQWSESSSGTGQRIQNSSHNPLQTTIVSNTEGSIREACYTQQLDEEPTSHIDEDYIMFDDLDEISHSDESSDDEDFSDNESMITPMIEPPRPVLLTAPSIPSELIDSDRINEEMDSLTQRAVEEDTLRARPIITEFGGRAGECFPFSDPSHQLYAEKIGNQDNIYAPFASKFEWELAKWAKLYGPSCSAFDDLLAIDGMFERLRISFKNTRELNAIIDKELPNPPKFMHGQIVVAEELYDVYYRDIVECIKTLFGNPDFAPVLAFKPERHYTDEAKSVRMYHDMHTGDWWWSTQEKVEAYKPGATIVPLIISTDKTQLTLFRGKTAYPMYLTIGNIPKEIRRKPTCRAWVLLAYLPTTKLEHVTNHAVRRRLIANLFHASIGRIMEPLQHAGLSGIYMCTGAGHIHRSHPLLASLVIDYPEQCLAGITYYMDCATCDTTGQELGAPPPRVDTPLRDADTVLATLGCFDTAPEQFLKACQEARIKPVIEPFWAKLPFCNIYQAITPDILHQLFQGVFKHIVSWVVRAVGPAEIDARCRRLPPNHNIHLFMNGISELSRITGQEHDQMSRFLLGLIVDIPLPSGLSSARLVALVRATLDFLYLAQYPIHTTISLESLKNSLHRFHQNKSILVDLGIREHFNIPKLHSMQHYAPSIKLIGTLDNVNTEQSERLHIDYTKNAYRATNRKNELPQMTRWLERRDSIFCHGQFIKWCEAGRPSQTSRTWSSPGLQLNRQVRMTKHPSSRPTIMSIIENHGATHFVAALARFIVILNNPNISRVELEHKIADYDLTVSQLPVWYRIKYTERDIVTGAIKTADSAHVSPARVARRGNALPGRFDTVLVRKSDHLVDTGGIHAYRVARIRVIFSLPPAAITRLIAVNARDTLPEHLAYVDLFTPFSARPEPHHLLYKVAPVTLAEGGCLAEVIPLSRITRSIELFPKFGPSAPAEWSSSTVLDLCKTFFVDTFTDKHCHRLLY